jgi:hypothetical protein
MTTNTEMLESLSSILTTAVNVPDSETSCLMFLINENSLVSQTCSGVSCSDCIFAAENYDQTMNLITTMKDIIKLEELIK